MDLASTLWNCGLKKGLMKNIRGNRLHLFFNQVEVFSVHRYVSVDYAARKSPQNIDGLDKLKYDLATREAQEQFQVVTIMSQLLSRPWMKQLYRGGGGGSTPYTHMQACSQVNCVMSRLEVVMLADELLLKALKWLSRDKIQAIKNKYYRPSR